MTLNDPDGTLPFCNYLPPHILEMKTETQSKLNLRAGDIFELFGTPCIIQRFFDNGGEINASWRDLRGAEFSCGFIPEHLIKPVNCVICDSPLLPDQAWTCRPICHSARALWSVRKMEDSGIEMEVAV